MPKDTEKDATGVTSEQSITDDTKNEGSLVSGFKSVGSGTAAVLGSSLSTVGTGLGSVATQIGLRSEESETAGGVERKGLCTNEDMARQMAAKGTRVSSHTATEP